MQINGLQATGATQSVSRTEATTPSQPTDSTQDASTVDQLDLSPEAQAISQTQAAGSTDGGIRTEKVAAIRQAIADGVYETPEKLSAALDKMLDTFA